MDITGDSGSFDGGSIPSGDIFLKLKFLTKYLLMLNKASIDIFLVYAKDKTLLNPVF